MPIIKSPILCEKKLYSESFNYWNPCEINLFEKSNNFLLIKKIKVWQ